MKSRELIKQPDYDDYDGFELQDWDTFGLSKPKVNHDLEFKIVLIFLIFLVIFFR